jgi:RNA polymerase sigma factor (sigma-70 family)
MTIKYKVSYLSDGTKVKITEELFNNLKMWESQGYKIEDKFKDELKKQDDVWLNSYRQYYRKSSSLEAETEKENPNQSILIDTSQSIEDIVMQNERDQIIYSILDECTETQKRRFIKYYYLHLSYSAIAKQEGCTKRAVGNSIKSAEQMLINSGNLI